MTQSFRELQVWQRAMQLTAAVYRVSSEFPREEIHGLAGQIRRAAVSVPSNISEGQGRANSKEFRQFLNIARGSNCEVQTQLEIARMLGMGKPELIDDADRLSHEVGRMIFALMESLKQQARSN